MNKKTFIKKIVFNIYVVHLYVIVLYCMSVSKSVFQ